MIIVRVAFLLLVAFFVAACAGQPAESPREGSRQAGLDSPGGPLPFGLEISREDQSLRATIINGAERLEVPRVEWNGERLILGIDHYDSSIEATLSEGGTRLDGLWRKTTAAEKPAQLSFHASAGLRPRFDTAAATEVAADASAVDGSWSVQFASDEEPAIGRFAATPDGVVQGTFLTTTGDYRYLSGAITDGVLRLSTFDGAHAFLFEARLQEDGTLAGDFWSRDTWHDTWTAHRDPDIALPDPFSLTSPIDGVDLAQLVFPDVAGNQRSLGEPDFAGAARVVMLFGTWCPNCNDATHYMVELHRRYRDRGLAPVGLAFELSGDFERDAQQVRTYAEHHGIEYPLLVAGRYGRDAESRSFPLIDRIRAYPTTIFLDGADRVRAVHTGFSGPATGEDHQRLRREFEGWIDALLDEAQGGS
jgi:hypothetical protein